MSITDFIFLSKKSDIRSESEQISFICLDEKRNGRSTFVFTPDHYMIDHIKFDLKIARNVH
jgi:hypothetical protein